MENPFDHTSHSIYSITTVSPSIASVFNFGCIFTLALYTLVNTYGTLYRPPYCTICIYYIRKYM